MSALTTLILVTLIALADEAGRAWLARIDTAARVQDAHLVLDVTTTDARGASASRTIEIWQKGDDRRLVRIVDPPRLKGVGLLVTHGETIHLFLPEYPPARRVVGSKRADAFLGTDFAVEDLSRLTWADRYDAVVDGNEGGLTRLALTPLDDALEARLLLWVGEDAVVRRIDTLGRDAVATRRLTLDDIRLEGEVLLAHRMSVEDLARKRRTDATVREVNLGGALSDELFTVTNLERP